jgi:hypothetical protein
LAAAARNLDTCALALRAELLDPVTGELVKCEERSTLLLDYGGAFAEPPRAPDSTRYANLVLCPNESDRTLVGRPLLARLTLTERATQRNATVELEVIPTCDRPRPGAGPADVSLCRCECRPHGDQAQCPD